MRPYNGGSWHGVRFQAALCDHCKAEAGYRADPSKHSGCPVLTKAMRFGVGEADYPQEWVIGEDEGGPRCTAYKPLTGHEEEAHNAHAPVEPDVQAGLF